MINLKGRLPLYFQIETVLRERIRSGHYPSGSGLPTEKALCETFAASRGTVRAALDALHRDGLIVRYPGRGAFVAEHGRRRRALRFAGTIEELIAQGAKMEFLVTECGLVSPDAPETAELNLPPGSRVMRITTLRLSGGKVIAHAVVSLPETPGVLLGLQAGRISLPIVSLLVEKLGLEIREARQVFDVSLATGPVAAALDVPVGAALFRITRTYFLSDGDPIEYAVSCYPADRYRHETLISTHAAAVAADAP